MGALEYAPATAGFETDRSPLIATNPFSFIPSAVAISQALAMTLPYLDVHFTESGPLYTTRVQASL